MKNSKYNQNKTYHLYIVHINHAFHSSMDVAEEVDLSNLYTKRISVGAPLEFGKSYSGTPPVNFLVKNEFC